MKIAMIGQKGIPSRSGGIEIHVEEISKRLVTYNCNIYVFCRKGYCDNIPINNKYNGINIKYTPYINTKHLDSISHTFFSTIYGLFLGCNIFHYHALGPSTLAFLPKLFGKKVVCTVHGLDWQRGKWGGFATKYLKFGEYATAKFSHKTINLSDNLVKYYKSKYNLNTELIPNGIEKSDRIYPNIIKNKYNLAEDSYILFLARLVPEKGAHYLIEAYKRLNTEKKLVIAGGSSHSTKYEKQLYDIAKGEENIVFTGFVSGNELKELYSNAYIYVLPSDIEGNPISLLEAMSYGNCCLTSNIPENTSVIDDYGYSFEKANVEDLVNKLKELLDNTSAVSSIKEVVTDFVLSKYNWDITAEKIYNSYKSLFRAKRSIDKK